MMKVLITAFLLFIAVAAVIAWHRTLSQDDVENELVEHLKQKLQDKDDDGTA